MLKEFTDTLNNDIRVITDKLEDSLGLKNGAIIRPESNVFCKSKDGQQINICEIMHLRPEWFEVCESETEKFLKTIE